MELCVYKSIFNPSFTLLVYDYISTQMCTMPLLYFCWRGYSIVIYIMDAERNLRGAGSNFFFSPEYFYPTNSQAHHWTLARSLLMVIHLIFLEILNYFNFWKLFLLFLNTVYHIFRYNQNYSDEGKRFRFLNVLSVLQFTLTRIKKFS